MITGGIENSEPQALKEICTVWTHEKNPYISGLYNRLITHFPLSCAISGKLHSGLLAGHEEPVGDWSALVVSSIRP